MVSIPVNQTVTATDYKLHMISLSKGSVKTLGPANALPGKQVSKRSEGGAFRTCESTNSYYILLGLVSHFPTHITVCRLSV